MPSFARFGSQGRLSLHNIPAPYQSTNSRYKSLNLTAAALAGGISPEKDSIGL